MSSCQESAAVAARDAGGRTTDFAGRVEVFSKIVATHSSVNDELISVLKEV